ncbi:hypothetical protein Syun_025024 [Stephania yunnanensis]|uniref:Uncharacterized protein n=1 Tax=Stephania yunnanensis TaxID=152371 RepID=A0AAP0HUF7_9MAGN
MTANALAISNLSFREVISSRRQFLSIVTRDNSASTSSMEDKPFSSTEEAI